MKNAFTTTVCVLASNVIAHRVSMGRYEDYDCKRLVREAKDHECGTTKRELAAVKVARRALEG